MFWIKIYAIFILTVCLFATVLQVKDTFLMSGLLVIFAFYNIKYVFPRGVIVTVGLSFVYLGCILMLMNLDHAGALLTTTGLIIIIAVLICFVLGFRVRIESTFDSDSELHTA